MAVGVGDTETRDGVSEEVDLDEHGGLIAWHPRIVARRDIDHCRRLQFDDATIRVLEVERAVGEEADVGVLARLGADQRPEVDGPPQTRRVDRSLDPGVADDGNVDLDRSERLVLGTGHRGEQRRTVGHRPHVTRVLRTDSSRLARQRLAARVRVLVRELVVRDRFARPDGADAPIVAATSAACDRSMHSA